MSVEKIAAWRGADGELYKNEQAARIANGRYLLDQLIGACISGHDYEIDIDQLVACKNQLIEAFKDASV